MTKWQRPKTTRRYIHPPMSERFYTLWSEGKLVFGEAEAALGGKYYDLVSAGMWFFDKGAKREFDIKSARLLQREDGIPTHGVAFKLGNLDFSLECTAPMGLTPACYIKIRLENNTGEESSERLGILFRTAKEAELIEEAPDCYASHDPHLSDWRKLDSGWGEKNGVYTDGVRKVLSKGNIKFSFDGESGEASAEICLVPGEACEEFFAFDIGEVSDFDYEAVRATAVEDWKRELGRIKPEKLPVAVRESAEHMKTISNLTVQLLQCFCKPKGTNFVFARQGGLQRQVWTFESMSVLESLSRIGDFADYIEPIIKLYFEEFLTESGEVRVFGIPWAMSTANVLNSFSDYAVRVGGAEFFDKYFEKAMRSFRWIKDSRASVDGSNNLVCGLFPPMQSCDADLVFQSWLFTDAFNIRGLFAFGRACEHFGKADAAKEVMAEYGDYMRAIRGIWDGIKREENGRIKIPYTPNLPNGVIADKFVFNPFIAFFVDALDFDIEDAEKVIREYTLSGMIRGGLYDRMPDKAGKGSTKFNLDENGRCVVWYVAFQEYYWFLYFLRHGARDKCEEILSALYCYAMTDEYYMIERYNERDPYFVPWSPNASANGRVINMILDFYK